MLYYLFYYNDPPKAQFFTDFDEFCENIRMFYSEMDWIRFLEKIGRLGPISEPIPLGIPIPMDYLIRDPNRPYDTQRHMREVIVLESLTNPDYYVCSFNTVKNALEHLAIVNSQEVLASLAHKGYGRIDIANEMGYIVRYPSRVPSLTKEQLQELLGEGK